MSDRSFSLLFFSGWKFLATFLTNIGLTASNEQREEAFKALSVICLEIRLIIQFGCSLIMRNDNFSLSLSISLSLCDILLFLSYNCIACMHVKTRERERECRPQTFHSQRVHCSQSVVAHMDTMECTYQRSAIKRSKSKGDIKSAREGKCPYRSVCLTR
jgi:hypothetical protein